MEKVERNAVNWLQEADKITDLAGLRWLYAKAKSANASTEILERLEARGKQLSSDGQSNGVDGGLPVSPEKGSDK